MSSDPESIFSMQPVAEIIASIDNAIAGVLGVTNKRLGQRPEYREAAAKERTAYRYTGIIKQLGINRAHRYYNQIAEEYGKPGFNLSELSQDENIGLFKIAQKMAKRAGKDPRSVNAEVSEVSWAHIAKHPEWKEAKDRWEQEEEEREERERREADNAAYAEWLAENTDDLGNPDDYIFEYPE